MHFNLIEESLYEASLLFLPLFKLLKACGTMVCHAENTELGFSGDKPNNRAEHLQM